MAARIKIDPDRQIGQVDSRIFGQFVEHLGRCIYGGLYEEGSPLSDGRGFRKDVLEAARRLRAPVLRWPGGNFASGYHWVDGVGPKDRRPRRLELAWHAEEPNRFGTDEFVEYCRALGAEPYICVNMGSGTMDEAQAWVEYCNGSGNTYWANLRRANGHAEPFGVKYWGLGNEMYGRWQIGALSADDYVRKAVEFAKVMKWTDPSIQLVGCGLNGWSDWDAAVIAGLAPFVDFHSVHIYTGSDDYYSNVFAPHQAERALRVSGALIERVRYAKRIERPIHVAYDEWNVWFRARTHESSLEERYTLADALAVATYLNVFIRHCKTVRLANLAQMVNVIAPIFTSPSGLFLQTIYHPLRLYAEHTQAIALDAFVDCATYDLTPEAEVPSPDHRVADLGPFKLLDVAATRDATRKLMAIGVVNRGREEAIPTTVLLGDGARVAEVTAYEVNGPTTDAINTFERPDEVTVSRREVAANGDRFDYAFPAHSATVLRLRLA